MRTSRARRRHCRVVVVVVVVVVRCRAPRSPGGRGRPSLAPRRLPFGSHRHAVLVDSHHAFAPLSAPALRGFDLGPLRVDVRDEGGDARDLLVLPRAVGHRLRALERLGGEVRHPQHAFLGVEVRDAVERVHRPLDPPRHEHRGGDEADVEHAVPRAGHGRDGGSVGGRRRGFDEGGVRRAGRRSRRAERARVEVRAEARERRRGRGRCRRLVDVILAPHPRVAALLGVRPLLVVERRRTVVVVVVVAVVVRRAAAARVPRRLIPRRARDGPDAARRAGRRRSPRRAGWTTPWVTRADSDSIALRCPPKCPQPREILG